MRSAFGLKIALAVLIDLHDDFAIQLGIFVAAFVVLRLIFEVTRPDLHDLGPGRHTRTCRASTGARRWWFEQFLDKGRIDEIALALVGRGCRGMVTMYPRVAFAGELSIRAERHVRFENRPPPAGHIRRHRILRPPYPPPAVSTAVSFAFQARVPRAVALALAESRLAAAPAGWIQRGLTSLPMNFT